MKAAIFIIIIFIFLSASVILAPILLRNFSSSLTANLYFESPATIYKSFNSGESWEPKVAIDKTQTLNGVNILDLAIDPQDSNVIFAGTKDNGLYRSGNAGEIWDKVKDGNKYLDINASVYKILIDPKNSANIYLAVFQGKRGALLRSRDRGISFSIIYTAPLDGKLVLALAINPQNPNILYLGGSDGGLLMSRDNGDTWKVLKWFLFAGVNNIALNPQEPQEIFVSTSQQGGFFKSTNEGATWQDLSRTFDNFPLAREIHSLTVDPQDSSIIYLGSLYGLLRSLNGGYSFQPVNILVPPQNLPVLSVAIDPNNHRLIYSSAGDQIYISHDFGQNWSVQRIRHKIGVIKIDQHNPTNIYLGINTKI